MISFVRKFYRNYSTKGLTNYWLKKDQTYWEEYLKKTWNHPHREILSGILNTFNWISLMEIGCGSGPNLINILKHFKGKQIGGVDPNPLAIEEAKKAMNGAVLQVGRGDDIMMSDKSTDISLTDMCLIYVGPLKIKQYLKELRRITRNRVVLCEYHSKSWWQRWKLRVRSGRHAYNYIDLLTKLGFYDILHYKMPSFEPDNEDNFRYVIVAKPPRYYV